MTHSRENREYAMEYAPTKSNPVAPSAIRYLAKKSGHHHEEKRRIEENFALP